MVIEFPLHRHHFNRILSITKLCLAILYLLGPREMRDTRAYAILIMWTEILINAILVLFDKKRNLRNTRHLSQI